MPPLLSRLLGTRRRLDSLTITVYSRDGCGCCTRALAVLEAARERHGFAIAVVDVDSDPALAAEHGSSVPVVALGGKVRFKGLVNPVLLERLLAAEASGRAES